MKGCVPAWDSGRLPTRPARTPGAHSARRHCCPWSPSPHRRPRCKFRMFWPQYQGLFQGFHQYGSSPRPDLQVHRYKECPMILHRPAYVTLYRCVICVYAGYLNDPAGFIQQQSNMSQGLHTLRACASCLVTPLSWPWKQ